MYPTLRCKEIRVLPKISVLLSWTLFQTLDLENFVTASRSSLGVANKTHRQTTVQLCLSHLRGCDDRRAVDAIPKLRPLIRTSHIPSAAVESHEAVHKISADTVSRGPSATADNFTCANTLLLSQHERISLLLDAYGCLAHLRGSRKSELLTMQLSSNLNFQHYHNPTRALIMWSIAIMNTK